MTVEELFAVERIDADILWAQSEESGYWEKACLFILDNWGEPVENFSKAQLKWCHKILEDLTEKRIEGKLPK